MPNRHASRPTGTRARSRVRECLAALCLTLSAFAPAVHAEAIVRVPVRFHIVTDLPMKKDGLVMRSWLTEQAIRHTVLPEVNRIWARADIAFELESVVRASALAPPDRDRLVRHIVGAHRNSDGESDPARIRSLQRLVDFSGEHPSAVNVWFVPYLGEASQGNTRRKLRRVFVGEWSDKASKGRQRPEKFQLIESAPMHKGSLSRTVAHELGHVLGLGHPDKGSQQVFGLLMGGRRAGYDLTRDEIETARRHAWRLSGR